MLINPRDTAAVASVKPKMTHRHFLGDLRTPGLLGQWPLIGLLLILLGAGLFGVLAISVQTHSLILLTDTQISNDLHVTALHSSSLLVGLMILGSYLGEQGIVAIGAVLVVYFLVKRFWVELIMVVIAWGGEGAIYPVVVNYFNRARPLFDISVWHVMPPPGFPSGHSFAAVLCFGLLAYLLVPKIPSRFGKMIVITAAALFILYIGFSRIFVGDHYPTDVLAGYGLGIAWGGLVYTSVELIAQRRKGHQENG